MWRCVFEVGSWPITLCSTVKQFSVVFSNVHADEYLFLFVLASWLENVSQKKIFSAGYLFTSSPFKSSFNDIHKDKNVAYVFSFWGFGVGNTVHFNKYIFPPLNLRECDLKWLQNRHFVLGWRSGEECKWAGEIRRDRIFLDEPRERCLLNVKDLWEIKSWL